MGFTDPFRRFQVWLDGSLPEEPYPQGLTDWERSALADLRRLALGFVAAVAFVVRFPFRGGQRVWALFSRTWLVAIVLLVLVVCAAALLVGVDRHSAVVASRVRTVTAFSLREGPDVEATFVGTIVPGSVLTIDAISEDGGWAYARNVPISIRTKEGVKVVRRNGWLRMHEKFVRKEEE